MKIEELLRNIEKETDICKKLQERIARVPTVKFKVEFPATKKDYDPAWSTDNSISEYVELMDKELFKKFKDIYIEHLNDELKAHQNILEQLLNKKEKIEEILSE